MKKSEIAILYKPNLNKPIFVEGLSSFEGVGSTVTRMLIEHSKAKKFAEFYSPYFPDYATASDDGLCYLPRYEFYTNQDYQPNLIILSGAVRPLIEDTVAHYELFHSIFEFAKEMGCHRFITFGNFASENMEREIYIASTSAMLSKSVTKELGGRVFGRGKIDGLVGMLLGFASLEDLQGICILGASPIDTPLETMSKPVLEYLLKVLLFEEK
ncbi:MAG: uncharacterized protein QG670_1230 [Thermoproteota archaeon]|nr:uncharacterized protein [Thermoproteota archaeon]